MHSCWAASATPTHHALGIGISPPIECTMPAMPVRRSIESTHLLSSERVRSTAARGGSIGNNIGRGKTETYLWEDT